MTDEFFRQSVSMLGAVVGLFAFIMLQMEVKDWGPKDTRYLLSCIVAGSFLSWAAIIDRNMGFIALNVIFTLFAIRGVGQRIWSRLWRI